jgi:arylsulfatase A-like enzyme
VHGPIETTKPLWEKYREKAVNLNFQGDRFKIDRTLPVRQVQDNPIYGGLIEEMDSSVGQVLDRLKELGLATNTIVIFTGDNGGVVSGDSYSSCQFPYRGGKGRQWEGGIRVPYYIRVPGVTKPGSICDAPVSGIDFYPTILNLAGIALPANEVIDGVSLVPLLRGGPVKDRSLFWHYPHYGNQGGEPASIIRKEGWKLIHYWEDGHNELYYLPDDIGEQHDLASGQPDRAARLWAELQAWLKDTGARFPQPYTGYNPASAAKNHQAAVRLTTRLDKEQADFLKPDWQPNKDWWKSLVPND